MRKEFVPLTARVIRRKPWARGKKNRTERKEMKPVRVEFITEEEIEKWNGRRRELGARGVVIPRYILRCR